VSDADGFLLVVSGNKRCDVLGDCIREYNSFTYPLSKPDFEPKPIDLALISLTGDTLDYVALARRGRKSAVATYTVTFRSIVDLDNLSLSTLEDHITPRTLATLRKAFEIGGKRLTEKTWLEVWKGVKKARRNLAAGLERLERLRDLQAQAYRGRAFEIVCQEKDAVTTALNIFDADSTRVFSVWVPPKSDSPAPFLRGMKHANVIEDVMIQHDQRVFGDWLPSTCHQVGAITLSRGDEKLTIVNVNRTAVERTLGVDLIYYLHKFRSFVMVQYKRMEREGNEPPCYRPVGKPYKKEIARMREFMARQPPHTAGCMDEFRFVHNPFFFKLCPKTLLDPTSSSPIPGMYIPLDYWDLLLSSPSVQGKKGGVAVSYNNAQRWLDNTLFVALVKKGWLGSPISAEKELSGLIASGLENDRSVVYASSSRRSNAKTRVVLEKYEDEVLSYPGLGDE
jgi:hypothetical protein